MRFWDSSALVPLIISEKETSFCRSLVEKDADILVWMLTPTEILSALHRKARAGGLPPLALDGGKILLSDLENRWSEVIQIELVRQKAARLLAVHTLRAADALQLAAALVAFEDQPEGEELVTFDKNLAEAAKREGFRVIP